MSHEMLEMLLHIRSDVDQSKKRYEDAVEMFLTEYAMVPFTKENAAYREALTYKSENLLKNPITMLLPFLIQLSRKMHRT